MRMINCSRSGVEPLKFWRLLKTVGMEGSSFSVQWQASLISKPLASPSPILHDSAAPLIYCRCALVSLMEERWREAVRIPLLAYPVVCLTALAGECAVNRDKALLYREALYL